MGDKTSDVLEKLAVFQSRAQEVSSTDNKTHEVRLLQLQEIIQRQLSSGQDKREWCRDDHLHQAAP